MKKKNISKKRGIASITIVMMLGMMTLAVVVSITSVVFNQLLISQNQAQSSSALFYAEAGARDALTKITRNKNYICTDPDCYMIDFTTSGCTNNTGCAKVSVSNGVGTTIDPKIITSSGIVDLSTRRMQVSVILDAGTTDPALQNGKITSAIWTELTD